MVGCAAPNCANSSVKGFRLFKFPKQPDRRLTWTINCQRDDWEPTPYSRLCEVHFDDSQYEQHRQDGKKLLKSSAVPSIFNKPTGCKYSKKESRKSIGWKAARKRNVLRGSLVPERPDKLNELRIQLELNEPKGSIENEQPICETNVISGKSHPPVPDQSLICSLDTNYDLLEDSSAPNEFSELERLKRENANLKSKVKRHQKQQAQLMENLKFLHNDQIESLRCFGYNSRSPWSEDTLKDALEIRSATGKNAYEFLRSKGYPFPHSSTLNRRLRMVDITDLLKNDYLEHSESDHAYVMAFD